jgi:protein-arginine deiminase
MRIRPLVLPSLASLLVVGIACTSPGGSGTHDAAPDQGSSPGSGGKSSMSASGGASGSGGATHPGGSGGAMGSGGAPGSGSGGRVGSGGAASSDSGAGAGGHVDHGGAGGSGGRGATGSGGSDAPTGGASGGGAAGSGGAAAAGLAVVTDTNRDGKVDASDIANFMDWSWKGKGAFLIANVDDDDMDGKSDASDQIVNGATDERDLARVLIQVDSALLAKVTSVMVSVGSGSTHVHLFEKSGATWKPVNGPLGQVAAQAELGVEAIDFADTGWDGMVTIKADLMDGTTLVKTQSAKLRVAPWLLLPNSAKSELVYIIGDSTGNALRADIDAVLKQKGLPACQTPTPSGQDQWYQDTMEIGYTQLPGTPPMHVVMTAQRGAVSDNVAKMLLAPDFGFISIGTVRSSSTGGIGGDHWMDWMGNLEVTHPMPGYPFGRVYHGRSANTTFHPTILKFIEAQELQKPISIYTEWLFIQHVDEIISFVMAKDGRPRMLVASPAAANEVLKTGYDADQQKIQGYLDEAVATMKKEIGIADADIIPLPVYYDGSGLDFAARWSDPVNSIFINGSFLMGQTDTPAAIKTSVESKLAAVGVEPVWVDDSNYHPGGGNVHCGTNVAKTPPCPDFAQCL